MNTTENFDYREPTSSEMEQVYDLRWNVLRDPKLPLDGTERDAYETQLGVVHGAAFDGNLLVATGRINRVVESPELMQVRYMATHPDYRGRGIGGNVLKLMEGQAIDLNAPEAFIANARVDALSLYMRAGYEVISDEFELVGVPHVKIHKNLA